METSMGDWISYDLFTLDLTAHMQNVVVVGWVMARSGARMGDGKRPCQDVVLGWLMARGCARMLC